MIEVAGVRDETQINLRERCRNVTIRLPNGGKKERNLQKVIEEPWMEGKEVVEFVWKMQKNT